MLSFGLAKLLLWMALIGLYLQEEDSQHDTEDSNAKPDHFLTELLLSEDTAVVLERAVNVKIPQQLLDAACSLFLMLQRILLWIPDLPRMSMEPDQTQFTWMQLAQSIQQWS